MLRHVEQGDMVGRVAWEITNAIASGSIEPGAQLLESEISTQLNVGRGQVRAAIGYLEEAGIVEKVPYRGTFVRVLTTDDVKALQELCEPLEGMAARLAAERQGPEAAVVLARILEEMRGLDPDGDRRTLVDLVASFHDSLVGVSGHKLLQVMWATISARLFSFLVLKQQRLYHSPGEAAALHEPLVAAIGSGDGDRAEREARRYVAHMGDQIVLEWLP